MSRSRWLNQMLHLKLREGLTRDLITEWMRPRRAFRLANAGAIGVNPDQRIHEDARHLADLSADLGIELVQASILLVSFVGVLWALSSGFVFHVGGRDIAIPGYMVWAAVIYAGTASVLSWLAGRPLIRLNSERYAREAELRFSLMRVNEHVDAISLAAGEADEKRRLDLDLATVLQAVRRIIVASVRLTWVTAGYGWITVVAPIVIASPVYFAGDLTFGGLMMAVGAFNQVHASLRWFVSNIGSIADWRATLLRVASFRSALLKVDDLHDVEKQIEFADAEAGHLTFDNIEVASRGVCAKLSETHVDIGLGERVLVTGGPGVGKTLFFRAIAGLWPWGSGRVGLPAGEAVTFIPNTPYFPPGSLRDVLSYPLGAPAFADADIIASLTKIGTWPSRRDARPRCALGPRISRATTNGCWLSRGLHCTSRDGSIIDEALDALPDDARKRVLSVFDRILPTPRSSMSARPMAFFPRVLHLAIDPHGHTLPPAFARAGRRG